MNFSFVRVVKCLVFVCRVWKAMNQAGKVAMPDNPDDVKDAVEKFQVLVKMWMGKVLRIPWHPLQVSQ